jgi:hypothetical protein
VATYEFGANDGSSGGDRVLLAAECIEAHGNACGCRWITPITNSYVMPAVPNLAPLFDCTRCLAPLTWRLVTLHLGAPSCRSLGPQLGAVVLTHLCSVLSWWRFAKRG